MNSVLHTRRSGVLLHPTSLPGPHGSGDFGPAAYHFIDWLHGAGQTLWQVLPLNPIGPGNSPYAGVSAFAGNPLLIALEPLIERGWLSAPEAATLAEFDALRVDYGQTIPWRMQQLRAAWKGFSQFASAEDSNALRTYAAEQAAWLDDYALFMALDHAFNPPGVAPEDWRAWCDWTDMDGGLAKRTPAALAEARIQYADAIAFWQFTQWCFETQWQALRAYGKARGVHTVGDLPIFIAHHSADCWARPDLYWLDDSGQPTVVAGVPPDFFSATGQRWGNPLYRWDAFEAEGFTWWIARVKRQLALADVVRIDHFRGFAAYWEIPASCPTAMEGQWVTAPGHALFSAIQAALQPALQTDAKAANTALPIIAEDLGVITPDVEALRDAFAFPGMRILQFGFGDNAGNAFLPHNYIPNTVAYTGTHDNDTARGWWATANEHERATAQSYLNCTEPQAHHGMTRAIMASVANTVIVPLQDVLGMDGTHRMNTPGLMGAWEWRFLWESVGSEPGAQLRALSAAFGRMG